MAKHAIGFEYHFATGDRIAGDAEAAKAQQLELQLMSNNTKKRRTLSVMTLATRVIERPDLLRALTSPWAHLQTLRRQATAAISQTVQGT